VSQSARSRRSVLQTGLRVVAGAGFLGLPDFVVNAQTSGRILVGVYLHGGNDGNNLVVPVDQYATYAGGRGALAIPAANLLRATGDGTSTIGFHPAMPQMRELFDSEALAVAANIGSETPVPTHSDNPDFAYFAPGYITSRWAASVAGATSLHPNGSVVTGFAGLPADHARGGASGLTMTGRGAAAVASQLADAAENVKSRFATPFPASSLGTELLQVARMIRGGSVSGVGFPHFFAVHSGYDTHSDQVNRQQALLADLSASIYAFHAAMVEMGVSRQVTLYTDSDFGRTLAPNAEGGTEHGWGNHQMIVGGAVMGGRVFGSFPDLALGSASDAGRTGVWKPAYSKEQYRATLAAWAGASQSQLMRFAPGSGGFAGPGLEFLS